MTKTSYISSNDEITNSVKASLDRMKTESLDSVIEAEMIMEQWRDRIHDGHIYAKHPTRYAILARRIPGTRRILVALHDRNNEMIYGASLEAGSIQDLASRARALVPPDTRFDINPNWRG